MFPINPDILKTFRRENQELCLTRSKITALATLFVIIFFSITDSFFCPLEMREYFLKLRVFLSAIFSIYLLFLYFCEKPALKYSTILLLILAIIAGVVMGEMSRHTGGFKSPYTTGLGLIILIAMALSVWHYSYQIVLWLTFQTFSIAPLFIIKPVALAHDFFSSWPFLYNVMLFILGFFSSLYSYLQYRLRLETTVRDQEKIQALSEANRLIKEMQAGLVRAETLSTVGTLAAGIAHNINTHMSGADMGLTLILDHLKDNEAMTKVARATLESVRNTKSILAALDHLSLNNRGGFCLADLTRGVEGVIDMYGMGAQVDRPMIHKSLDPDVHIHCNLPFLQSALINLINNAIQSRAKNIHVDLKKDGDGGVTISVADDGCGVPEEVRDRIFDPFFTTKDVGEGTGLGLWMVYRTVMDHGGRIKVTSTVGQGSRFEVGLGEGRPKIS